MLSFVPSRLRRLVLLFLCSRVTIILTVARKTSWIGGRCSVVSARLGWPGGWSRCTGTSIITCGTTGSRGIGGMPSGGMTTLGCWDLWLIVILLSGVSRSGNLGLAG